MQITEFKNDLSEARIIKNQLLSDGRSYTWLARNLQCSVCYVHLILNEKETLTDTMKTKMRKLLKITD